MCQTRPDHADDHEHAVLGVFDLSDIKAPGRYKLVMVDSVNGTGGVIGACDEITQVGAVLREGVTVFERHAARLNAPNN